MQIPVGVEVLLLIFADGHGRDLAAVVSHEPLPQFRRQATTEFAFGHLDPRFLHGERHSRKKTTRLLLSPPSGAPGQRARHAARPRPSWPVFALLLLSLAAALIGSGTQRSDSPASRDRRRTRRE